MFLAGRMDADLEFGDTTLNVGNPSIFLARYGVDCPVYTDTTVVLCYGDFIEVGNNIYSQTGEYQVLLQTINGGDSIVNLNISVFPPIISGLPNDTTICVNQELTLTANSGFESYYWNNGSTDEFFTTSYSHAQIDTIVLSINQSFETEFGLFYCDHTDTVIVHVTVCTKNHLQQTASLGIYPNPATNNTKLVFPEISLGTLMLFDSSGRLLWQEKVRGNHYNLNIQEYKQGMYYIKLFSEKFTVSEKLLIQ